MRSPACGSSKSVTTDRVAHDNPQSIRLRLSRAIVRWVLVDLGGLVLLLLGGLWLIAGLQIVPGFPSSGGQAWFCIALGFALMLYAIVEILKEVLTPRPRPTGTSAAGRD